MSNQLPTARKLMVELAAALQALPTEGKQG